MTMIRRAHSRRDMSTVRDVFDRFFDEAAFRPWGSFAESRLPLDITSTRGRHHHRGGPPGRPPRGRRDHRPPGHPDHRASRSRPSVRAARASASIARSAAARGSRTLTLPSGLDLDARHGVVRERHAAPRDPARRAGQATPDPRHRGRPRRSAATPRWPPPSRPRRGRPAAGDRPDARCAKRAGQWQRRRGVTPAGRSTSSAWPPSWSASTLGRCASTRVRAWSARPAPARTSVSTPRTTCAGSSGSGT